jgi:hypothetical protein
MSYLNKITSAFTVPALFLTTVLVIDSIGSGILAAKGVETEALDLLARVALLWALVWWLKLDSKRHGIGQVYCLGLLGTTGGVVLFPYHLVKTRGLIGLLLIVLLLAIVITCQGLTVITYLVFGGPLELPGQP